jgi:hypothetical protein
MHGHKAAVGVQRTSPYINTAQQAMMSHQIYLEEIKYLAN